VETSKVFFMHFPDGGGLTAYFGADASGAALPAPAKIAHAFEDGGTGAKLAFALQPKKQAGRMAGQQCGDRIRRSTPACRLVGGQEKGIVLSAHPSGRKRDMQERQKKGQPDTAQEIPAVIRMKRSIPQEEPVIAKKKGRDQRHFAQKYEG